MIMDALNTPSLNQDLTAIGAGTTGYSNVIDLAVSRDIGVAEVPVAVVYTTLPTSGTGGATLNVAIQTSADNVTYVTLEETSPQLLSAYSVTAPWAFRGTLPTGVLRYLRFAYTPSAALTTGQVTATIGADWPRSKTYPRNYAA